MSPLKIGIDYGGVCSIYSDTYEEKSKTDEEINVPGCIEALKKLKELGHKLILVSFCGSKRARKTRSYLTKLQLFDNMYFVKKRSFKKDICNHEGLDLLIDDRLDILQTINFTDTLLFKYKNHPSNMNNYFDTTYVSDNWNEIVEILAGLNGKNLRNNKTINVDKLCHR